MRDRGTRDREGPVARWFDVRRTEQTAMVTATALVLLLVAGHTVLETARDTLLLTRLGPRWLNYASIASALLSFPLAGLTARLTRRLGTLRTLLTVLWLTVLTTAAAAALPSSRGLVIALSVFAPLAGALLVAQFWVLAGTTFSVSQSRRLFALLAAGGVVGAVLGAGLTMVALRAAPTHALLAVASTLFGLAALVACNVRAPVSSPIPVPLSQMLSAGQIIQKHALLRRLAVLAAISTIVFVVLDYTFKTSAALRHGPDDLGAFFARFNLVTNVLSLVVQVAITPPLLRRLGVIGAVAFTPLFLMLGGVGVALTGAMAAVALTKVVDGSLRYTLHRVSTELLALPLPAEARAEGKVAVDTVVPRLAQAAGAGALLVLATRVTLTPRHLGVALAGVALLWLIAAVTTRARYLDAFHRSLQDGLGEDMGAAPLDLDAAAVLVEGLASRDDGRVLAAMDLLAHHGQERLVSALILHHESEAVLLRALRSFGASTRTDWIPLAEGLVATATPAVRIAALSALVRHGRFDLLESVQSDSSPELRAYAAYQLALREPGEVLRAPPVRHVLASHDLRARRALLAAAADDPQTRAASLLLHLAHDGELLRGADSAADLAHAMDSVADPRFVPTLVELLGARVGREAVMEALVHLGDAAFDALVHTLEHGTDRRVRLHVPRALGRFGTQRAADVLTERLSTETEGVVRYKLLRGLGLLVGTGVRFDVPRLAAACVTILSEQLRLATLRSALGDPLPTEHGPELPLLRGLLEDKREQALERVFRLLKLMHAEHDIHRMHRSASGIDPKERSQVLEYLDALLVSDAERPLRPLLRLALDDLEPRERAIRVAGALHVDLPPTRHDALVALSLERDRVIAKLAAAALARKDSHRDDDPNHSARSATAADRRAVARPVAGSPDVGNPTAHAPDA